MGKSCHVSSFWYLCHIRTVRWSSATHDALFLPSSLFLTKLPMVYSSSTKVRISDSDQKLEVKMTSFTVLLHICSWRRMSSVVLKLEPASESPRWLRKQTAGHTPGVSDSVGLGWDLRIHISNNFPGGDASCFKNH